MNPRIDALRRQQMLAHLNDNGRSNVKQISDALKVDRSTVRVYLNELLTDKAVAQTTQIDGSAATPYYTALVQTPAPSTEPKSQLGKAQHSPGRTVNLGTERSHPLPSPRGQGALCQRTYVGSCAG